MASGRLPLWLGATLACMAIDAVADESTDVDEELDVEFLEYLGRWDATDEDWFLFEGAVTDNEERRDPAPKGEESAENEDED